MCKKIILMLRLARSPCKFFRLMLLCADAFLVIYGASWQDTARKEEKKKRKKEREFRSTPVKIAYESKEKAKQEKAEQEKAKQKADSALKATELRAEGARVQSARNAAEKRRQQVIREREALAEAARISAKTAEDVAELTRFQHVTNLADVTLKKQSAYHSARKEMDAAVLGAVEEASAGVELAAPAPN